MFADLLKEKKAVIIQIPQWLPRESQVEGNCHRLCLRNRQVATSAAGALNTFVISSNQVEAGDSYQVCCGRVAVSVGRGRWKRR